MSQEKKIVIIGAGFGGLRAVLELERKFRRNRNVSITLVDKNDYQLFAPDLYEIASSPEEFAGLDQLSKASKIPLPEVLGKKKIRFVKGEVLEIDNRNKKIRLPGKKLDYDYLVVATGSRAGFLGIPGAEKHGRPLKTLSDALRIRNDISFAIESHRLSMSRDNLRIVVAGGGCSGVELAAELVNLADVLAWKTEYPREKIEILVVEALPRVGAFEDQETSAEILERIKSKGVRVALSSFIVRVDEKYLHMANGERIAFDVLAWTVGTVGASLPWTGPMRTDRKGRLVVGSDLRLLADDAVFAIGDCAAVSDAHGDMAPPTVWAALSQARYVAHALALLLANKKPIPYRLPSEVFMVTLGGRRALLRAQKGRWVIHIIGLSAYIMRELIHLNYMHTLLGWWKAVKYVWFQASLWGRND